MAVEKKEQNEVVGIDEFMEIIGLSRNAVLNAIKEKRIESAYKDDEGFWKFSVARCMAEYRSNTKAGKSRNFDEGDGGGFRPVTDQEIDKRRSVFTIPHDKWTVHEAEQAEAIYDALESKLRYEAKQGLFYPKESTDKKFNHLAKSFADGLKRIPDELRQRHPDISKPQLKTLEKIIDDIRKEISRGL